MMNGISKWTYETKKTTKKGGIDYVESLPLLCDCGGSSPIGGDGAALASFFYTENSEWECIACGKIINPSIRDYEKNER